MFTINVICISERRELSAKLADNLSGGVSTAAGLDALPLEDVSTASEGGAAGGRAASSTLRGRGGRGALQSSAPIWR